VKSTMYLQNIYFRPDFLTKNYLTTRKIKTTDELFHRPL